MPPESAFPKCKEMLSIASRLANLGWWAYDDVSGRLALSRRVVAMYGLPHDSQVTLEETYQRCGPEFQEELRKRFAACMQLGEPYEATFEIVRPSGDRLWIRTLAEPTLADDQTVVGVRGACQDVTAQKHAEETSRELADRLQTTLESITDGFFTVDRQWRFSYVNPEAARLLRRSHEELVGKLLWDEFPDVRGTPIWAAYRRAMETGETATLEAYYDPIDCWFDIRAYPSSEGLAIYFRDQTERHALLERLRTHEQSLRQSRDHLTAALSTRQALINALPAHIALVDDKGTIIDVNEQWRVFAQHNGYSDPVFGIGTNYPELCRLAQGDSSEHAAEVGKGLEDVLAGRRASFTTVYPCHAPNEERWFRVMIERLNRSTDGPASDGAVLMHLDITERYQAQRELSRLAHRDYLTETHSRGGYIDAVQRSIDENAWHSESSIVLLDVEHFRDINDAHGYTAGDELLRQIGQRLSELGGPDALVSRIGGDEFAVFLPVSTATQGTPSRDSLEGAFEQEFRINDTLIKASARFGYTVLENRPRCVEAMLREAELALFCSRQLNVSGSCERYTQAIDTAARERIEISRELRHALIEDQLELHFQPKVELDTGQLTSGEALVRWRHPQRGLLSPGLFIPVAEQSQLIAPMGAWILNCACRNLRAWMDAGLSVVRVAVNVSLVQFRVGDFYEQVRSALEAHDVAPSALTLEITESVFEQESAELRGQIDALHELGVRLSLDDFGTGYSSLTYLQNYPFDEIKIDRAFVSRMLTDDYSREIVQFVIRVAKSLGAEVIAEGIETPVERDALIAMGCRFGQGFYFSFPLETEDFCWLLERRSPLPLTAAAS